MHGGGEAAIITEWKRLGEQEADAALRSTFAVLALTFAELTRGLVAWQKALENWNMKESQTMLRWIREGEALGELRRMRANLIRTLEVRFPTQVPGDLKDAVEGTNDLDTLGRWFDAALIAPTLPTFRATMTAT